MAYGTIKVDTVTFTSDGVDKSVTLSGLVQNPTFSGNVTVTGTLSGVTVTGTTANFASGNFTNISGGTHTITSGVFAAGSAASPSITFTGDLNTGIYSPGADQLALTTGGTGRLRIDSNGKVGVGATPGSISYSINLPLSGGTTCYGLRSLNNVTSEVTAAARIFTTETTVDDAAFTLASLQHFAARQGTFGASATVTNQIGFVAESTLTGATNNYGFYGNIASGTGRWNFYANGTADSYFASNNFIWANGGTERARIDSSGRLLVNTSSAYALGKGRITQTQVHGLASANASSGLCAWGTAALPELNLARSRGATVGTRAVVNSGDILGDLFYSGDDGTNFIAAASIQAAVDGTPGTNDMPGRLVFSTTADGASSPTERMRITSAGNVGIGTASPGELLTVANATNTDATIKDVAYFCGNYASNSGSGARILIGGDIPSVTNRGVALVGVNTGGAGNAHDMVFEVSGTGAAPSERARIDSSGRLLVGTSSARSNFFNASTSSSVQVEGTTTDNSAIAIIRNSANSSSPLINFAKSRSTSVGGNTLVADGDQLGAIWFQGADGTEFVPGASIQGVVDGTPGTNDMPGRLVFSTTADGASSPTERMRISNAGTTTLTSAASTAPFIANIGASEVARIDSSGKLLVGTSSAYGTNAISNAITSYNQVAGSSIAAASTLNTYWANNVTGSAVNQLAKSRGALGIHTIVQSGDRIGAYSFAGSDGSSFIESARIEAFIDGTPGANDMPGRLVFSTTEDGASTPTERLRITNDGVQAYNQPAPAAVNATATLTVDNLKAGIITSTSAAATDMTLPTGTDTEAGFNGVYTNFTFEWSVINTGPSLVRVLAGTAHTIVGSGSVATGTSGRFASRRTAANTFVTYRLS